MSVIAFNPTRPDPLLTLPQSIDSCTNILGPLRQAVFACLTCNPSPSKPGDDWTPAGVCYACSVQCHGEHTLVEIFQKRNFTCDCGTTRIPSTSPCTLRLNEETNTKGGVHSQEPDANNKYNQNFRNRFCGCECDYDPFQQKGTMFQCLGLGAQETGGCGEDWYHPGCLMSLGPNWFEKMEKPISNVPKPTAESNGLVTIAEDGDAPSGATEDEIAVVDEEDDVPMPPGFPEEEAFEGFLCYKCVDANPWIRQYAGTSGFLPPLFVDENKRVAEVKVEDRTEEKTEAKAEATAEDKTTEVTADASRKRKAEDEEEETTEAKRLKSDVDPESPKDAPPASTEPEITTTDITSRCKLPNLPPAPTGQFSLFFHEDFRSKFCHCPSCYPHLNAHPQLLEEEEVYEPPLSDGAPSQHGGSTAGSGSLLERGESALRNVDRVRAIEGVMAYNHLKERLKPFFQQFAESGQAIGAEDIKQYFAKLRGDEEGIKEAGEKAKEGKGDEGGDRREQSGY